MNVLHSIPSGGVWTPDGEWIPVPYVDEHRAELLFRHKIFTLLRDRGLISHERIDLLLSWRHSGFSVHNRTTVYPSDIEGLHKLACYLMRAPVFNVVEADEWCRKRSLRESRLN